MSAPIIETPTPEQDYLRDNIKNSINLLATQYYIEVKNLNMLMNTFVEITIAHKSLENPKLKSTIKTLFSEIQKTNKNVFLLSSIFFLIKHSSKTADVVEVTSGGKMSGGNVSHFLIILMWILYGTYFLSTGSLTQTSILSQDGNNQQVSIDENVVGEQLYLQYGKFMTKFAEEYNKQIKSKLRGSLQGILPIEVNNTNQTLTVVLPNEFGPVYDSIIADTEFQEAKQNIIENYIPTGADLVSVLEDVTLRGFVNNAAGAIGNIEITPATIVSVAENALSVAKLASNAAIVAAKNPVISTAVASFALKPTLKELADKYNNIIDVFNKAEQKIKGTYDAAIQLIASNPNENIERLNQLKAQIVNHTQFVTEVNSKTSNLRGTIINAVKDLVNDKQSSSAEAIVTEPSNKITDTDINELIKNINVNIFMFATNVSYAITKTTGSIIINFCKKMISDIYKQNFDSLIGATAFLIPLFIFSGFLKINSKKQAIENAVPAPVSAPTSTGGRKTKKPRHLKKTKKTQKKNKYSRKLRKNSVI